MQTVDLQPDTHYYISMMVKLLNQSDDVTGEVVKLNYNYDGRTRLSTRTCSTYRACCLQTHP